MIVLIRGTRYGLPVAEHLRGHQRLMDGPRLLDGPLVKQGSFYDLETKREVSKAEALAWEAAVLGSRRARDAAFGRLSVLVEKVVCARERGSVAYAASEDYRKMSSKIATENAGCHLCGTHVETKVSWREYGKDSQYIYYERHKSTLCERCWIVYKEMQKREELRWESWVNSLPSEKRLVVKDIYGQWSSIHPLLKGVNNLHARLNAGENARDMEKELSELERALDREIELLQARET